MSCDFKDDEYGRRTEEQIHLRYFIDVLYAGENGVDILIDIQGHGEGQCGQRDVEKKPGKRFLFFRGSLDCRDPQKDEGSHQSQMGCTQNGSLNGSKTTCEVDLEETEGHGQDGGDGAQRLSVEADAHENAYSLGCGTSGTAACHPEMGGGAAELHGLRVSGSCRA